MVNVFSLTGVNNEGTDQKFHQHVCVLMNLNWVVELVNGEKSNSIKYRKFPIGFSS